MAKEKNKDSQEGTEEVVVPAVPSDIELMTKEPEPEVKSTEEVAEGQWFKITTSAQEYTSRKIPNVVYRKGQPRYTKNLEEVRLCMVNGHFTVVKVSTEEATTAPVRPLSTIRPGSRRN